MAISAPTRRRPNSDAVRGVDFDMKNISDGLASPLIDVPKNQTIEERMQWLQTMMTQRRLATLKR
jgi:hypothetical protein